MTKLIPITILISVLFFISACTEDVDSEDIHTSGMYAKMEINASDIDASHIKVTLLVGGENSNTYVNLTAGDEIIATLNDSTSQTLTKQKSGGEITYQTTFSETDAGNAAKYDISFSRPNETDAPNSTVTLPANITQMALDKTEFSRLDDSVTLTWDGLNNSKKLTVKINGTCIKEKIDTVTDNGLYTLNAGSLSNLNQNAQNCAIDFTLSRSASGQLDSNFGEGGEISADVSNTISISSTL